MGQEDPKFDNVYNTNKNKADKIMNKLREPERKEKVKV